jgi:alpha-beta hydrolase superfamily lysophospholipase
MKNQNRLSSLAALACLFLLPSAAWTASISPPGAKDATLETSVNVQMQAVDLLEKGQNDEARKLVVSQLKGKSANAGDRDLYYMLALIDVRSENYKGAIKDLESTLAAEKTMPTKSTRNQAVITKRIADAYYSLRDIKSALSEYKAALALANQLAAKDPLRGSILEAMVGCFIRQDDPAAAESYAKQLVELDSARAASGRLSDTGAYFWAQMELLDVYRRQGKTEERLALRKTVLPMLDKLLSLRSQLEASGKLPTLDDFRQEFLADIVSENPPQCLADYLWLALNWKMFSLPLIRWQPDAGVQPKAAILCIHGLGLENRSFTTFGKEMARRGYLVYAGDMRGFGSWLAVHGQEDVDFETAIADIGSVITMIEEFHDKIPVVSLGESMGGGIALRAGMKYAKQIKGIIASVPSAERFQQKRMSFRVAMHFLRGKDRPFDIGESVTKQATSNEDVQREWQTDPKAKMDMSPKELIKFALFMRTTTEECKNLTSTPTFVVQGLKDRLVKPAGTYEIFDNIQSEDKWMTIIGNAEHLIFESENQNVPVLDSLCSWLSHLDEKQSKQ